MVLRRTLTLNYYLSKVAVTRLNFETTSVYRWGFFLLLSAEAGAGVGLPCCLRATAAPTIVTSLIHPLVELQNSEISLGMP